MSSSVCFEKTIGVAVGVGEGDVRADVSMGVDPGATVANCAFDGRAHNTNTAKAKTTAVFIPNTTAGVQAAEFHQFLFPTDQNVLATDEHRWTRIQLASRFDKPFPDNRGLGGWTLRMQSRLSAGPFLCPEIVSVRCFKHPICVNLCSWIRFRAPRRLWLKIRSAAAATPVFSQKCRHADFAVRSPGKAHAQ